MTEEQKKFVDIKQYKDYKSIGLDVDYAVIVDKEKQEVILQFKQSDSSIDWLNNFLFIPWPLKLAGKTVWTTLGYARAYKSTEGKPLEEFITECCINYDYKRTIRGWSFGSAMAKIAGRHLSIRYGHVIIDELTTYGDVKCWLNPFCKYTKKIKRVREYTTANDLVTWCVPFFHRDRENKVGPALKLKELFKSEQYHTHYEQYDYTEWEEA